MGWPTEFVEWNMEAGWVEGAQKAMAWSVLGWALMVATVLLLAMLGVRIRRRRFWCAGVRREVEVEFEERGIPGFRKAMAVLTCTAFDPPSEVSCTRRCLDRDYRLKGPIAHPVGHIAVP